MQNASFAAMRTHKSIIQDVGPKALHDALGFAGKENTVRSWVQRDSIPGEHWKAIADAGFSTLEELASAAARTPHQQRVA